MLSKTVCCVRQSTKVLIGHRAGIRGGERQIGARFADPDQALGFRIRQRPQQHRIDDAEEGRVRADPDREQEDGDGGEPGTLADRAKRVAEILAEGIEARQTALIAVALLGGFDAAELAVCARRCASSGGSPRRMLSSVSSRMCASSSSARSRSRRWPEKVPSTRSRCDAVFAIMLWLLSARGSARRFRSSWPTGSLPNRAASCRSW